VRATDADQRLAALKRGLQRALPPDAWTRLQIDLKDAETDIRYRAADDRDAPDPDLPEITQELVDEVLGKDD